VAQRNAQRLVHRHFATVCSRITRLSPKCSEINWQHDECPNIE